jgi:hypothetical protein
MKYNGSVTLLGMCVVVVVITLAAIVASRKYVSKVGRFSGEWNPLSLSR